MFKVIGNFFNSLLKMDKDAQLSSRLLWGNIGMLLYCVLTCLEKTSNSGAFSLLIVSACLLGLSVAETVLTGIYENKTVTTSTSSTETKIDVANTVNTVGDKIDMIINKKKSKKETK